MRIKDTTPAFLIIALLCCSLKCRKDEDKPPATLPPITQEGKNTFGCKVDDEVWIPYYKCGGSGNPCGELFVSLNKILENQLPRELNIGVGLKGENNSQSFFSLSSPLGEGINGIGDKIDSIDFKYVKPGSFEYREIPGMGLNNNFIITKLDTINKIISGTFEATLYKTFTDSVKITDGRFDLKFQACQCSN